MLNLSVGGEFIPIVKFNAKSGKWYRRDLQGDEYVDTEITDLTAVFDLEYIDTGWLKFSPNIGPEFVPHPENGTKADRPDDGYKEGFRIPVYSEKQLGGIRELMSNSSSLNRAMIILYKSFEEQAQPGKVPLVKCVGVHANTGKHGTNYQPDLVIERWVDRPEALKNGADNMAALVHPPSSAPWEEQPPTEAADTEF